jgi:hypothetical protein
VKSLGWEMFYAMKDPLLQAFLLVINSVSITLTSVVTIVMVPLSGVSIVDLELHPRVPQQEPLTRVPCAFPCA